MWGAAATPARAGRWGPGSADHVQAHPPMWLHAGMAASTGSPRKFKSERAGSHALRPPLQHPTLPPAAAPICSFSKDARNVQSPPWGSRPAPSPRGLPQSVVAVVCALLAQK